MECLVGIKGQASISSEEREAKATIHKRTQNWTKLYSSIRILNHPDGKVRFREYFPDTLEPVLFRSYKYQSIGADHMHTCMSTVYQSSDSY